LTATHVPPISHSTNVPTGFAPGTVLATLAVALPTLLAFNVPPSATFLNQAAALIGWGAWAILLCMRALPGVAMPRSTGLWALLAALGLMAASTLSSTLFFGLPNPFMWSLLGSIAAAALTTFIGAQVARSDHADAVFRDLCIALLVAGALSMVVAAVQVFAPDRADGNWIAVASEARASGNLRQPNHLSSLLLWSIIACVWLGQRRVLRPAVAALLSVVFIAGLVLSASRTGALGTAILAVWGLFEGGARALQTLQRRASRGEAARTAPSAASPDKTPARAPLAPILCALLILAPLCYWLLYEAFTLWAHSSHHVLMAESRFTGEGDISSSRFAIWSNTLSLIAQHPWAGVGFGEFNFAWSLTPFPDRPVAFFDHTHNLVLQFAVEMGVPLAALVLVLLSFALVMALIVGLRGPVARRPMLRAAFMMVLMMAIHSQLEYPLWYAYFLLPTAFMFGLCLGADEADGALATPIAPAEARRRPPAARHALTAAAALLLAGGIASVFDYSRVVAVFSEGGTSLAQRIAIGQRSWFFAQHADYAAATTAEHPSDALPSFKVATHYLLDTRLMIAWANALNESGDVERARHIAQRLREFRNPDAKPFFAPCDDPSQRTEPLAFQCTPPTKRFDYRDFR
jgi:O-antigen ligase